MAFVSITHRPSLLDRFNTYRERFRENRAKRAERARRHRHEHRVEACFLGQQHRMRRPSAAIGNQRELTRVGACRGQELDDLGRHLCAGYPKRRLRCLHGA